MSTDSEVREHLVYYCYHYANSISPTPQDIFMSNFMYELDSDRNIRVLEWHHESPIPTIDDLKLIPLNTALSYKYFNNRQINYPPINEQLDLLWHDLKSGTPLDQGSWFANIQNVKDTYPKLI